MRRLGKTNTGDPKSHIEGTWQMDQDGRKVAVSGMSVTGTFEESDRILAYVPCNAERLEV